MTYDELLAMCTRAAGIRSSTMPLTLHDVVGVLQMIEERNRAITAEVLARFMVEFIEGEREPRKALH